MKHRAELAPSRTASPAGTPPPAGGDRTPPERGSKQSLSSLWFDTAAGKPIPGKSAMREPPSPLSRPTTPIGTLRENIKSLEKEALEGMQRRAQLGRERRDTEDSLQHWNSASPGAPQQQGKQGRSESCENQVCKKLRADLKAKEAECASLEMESNKQTEEVQPRTQTHTHTLLA